ncbi:phospholysine phosphohistidine inorganic pyrophosphate phosphatase isoform X3 [Eptesicus fuscus]|uniref:phospholysine phosphohistidine inorganic pyrophosphate phosphatase isoform X3 n=1 Tax=Eptesicus fuscus TaxID=29078 RepID=UPI002403C801|nr:phospholysine phosphohistidine inorganic pyrophosphate phosphatase isoform X3 [Eptesicus fuscus]
MAAWGDRLAGVRGVLLDISGVLYDSGEGGGRPIAGSVEAVARLRRSGLKVRFCTNESQKSRGRLVGELRRLGFDVAEAEVTAPPPAACRILRERGLRPHLLVHDEVRSEFDQIDTSNPNCVVIGDAGEHFSYRNMNRAFQALLQGDLGPDAGRWRLHEGARVRLRHRGRGGGQALAGVLRVGPAGAGRGGPPGRHDRRRHRGRRGRGAAVRDASPAGADRQVQAQRRAPSRGEG